MRVIADLTLPDAFWQDERARSSGVCPRCGQRPEAAVLEELAPDTCKLCERLRDRRGAERACRSRVARLATVTMDRLAAQLRGRGSSCRRSPGCWSWPRSGTISIERAAAARIPSSIPPLVAEPAGGTTLAGARRHPDRATEGRPGSRRCSCSGPRAAASRRPSCPARRELGPVLLSDPRLLRELVSALPRAVAVVGTCSAKNPEYSATPASPSARPHPRAHAPRDDSRRPP